jgi:hypothetical protein
MSEPVRIAPEKSVKIGGTIVTNKTANSIEVVANDENGGLAISVVDCCLEEQGK